MTPAVLVARCHPKRKRAHVSYYESSSGDSDADDSSSPTEGLLSRKVCFSDVPPRMSMSVLIIF